MPGLAGGIDGSLSRARGAVTDLAIRKKMVETARRMNALGINQGRSGNLSVRAGVTSKA